MADAPKLNAYSVTFVFGTGPICQEAIVAPSPEAATALIMHKIMQSPPAGVETLTGVAVMLLTPEWLGMAHRVVVEGRKPEGSVVSLVPQAKPEEAASASPPPAVDEDMLPRKPDLPCPGRPYDPSINMAPAPPEAE